MDGSEVRANASLKSLTLRGSKGPDDEEPPEGSAKSSREPEPAGEWKGRGQRYSNETHFSATDPDARLHRRGDRTGARLVYLAHDRIDTKSRAILRRRVTQARGSAERDTALEMLDDILEVKDELGLPNRPEILTEDAGYGATELITEVMDRGIDPHVPLLADEALEETPTWTRRTFNLNRQRARQRKVKEVEAMNRVRHLRRTRGYTVSRKLWIRSEHLFAEAKNEHGLGRARRRGRQRVEDQAKWSAVVQNLKRPATFCGRTGRGAAQAAAGSVSSAATRRIPHLFRSLAHIRIIVTQCARKLRSAGRQFRNDGHPLPTLGR